MYVSVIVPYYDREKEVKNLLLSLEQQSNKEFEVIIVNDGSNDISEEIQKMNYNLNINYIYTERSELSGRSSARNIGIGNAQGDLLIFLDADQIVEDDFIQNYIDSFKKCHNKSIMQFSTRKKLKRTVDLLLEDVKDVSYNEDTRKKIFSNCKDISKIDGIWFLVYSHNIAIKKEDLVKYGGFDVRFKGWGLEDVELAYRMKKNNVDIEYNYKTESYNQYKTSIENDDEKYNQWKGNLDIFKELHPDPEIQLQNVFKLYFDPNMRKRLVEQGIDNVWLMCFEIFEFALQKLHNKF